ncbi:MAG TPA: DUF2268 domain-containing putative Zn-dependent protease [Longimicrobiales bacterium]|nr:DUF2268 domain-containing putative Zn-dependent protease [Longimicrobiales bacterium]
MPKLPRFAPIGSFALAATLAACGDTPTALENLVKLPGGGALYFQGAAANSPQRPRIEEIVKATVASARDRIPLDNITVTVGHGTEGRGLIPQFGFGGLANAGAVAITIDPANPAWPASLETEFDRLLAHLFHHLARFRLIGFNDHLLDALVTEGLADHFTVELLGGEPAIWTSAVQGAELEMWIQTASETWLEPEFDRAPWFHVGVESEVPTWTGYAIGWELTSRYLEAHPEASASTLLNAPGEAFAPAE